jgi:hypothetical protein
VVSISYIIKPDKETKSQGKQVVCKECLKEEVECYACGKYIKKTKAHREEIGVANAGEVFLCPDLHGDNPGKTPALHRYDFSMSPKSLGLFTDATESIRTMGCELEVDGDDGSGIVIPASIMMRKYCKDICTSVKKPVGYMMYDGSLKRGFEFASYPATLRYHLTEYPWKEIIAIRDAYGLDATTNASHSVGFHVHVAKAWLSTTKWAQLVFFAYSHASNLRKIAGRTQNVQAPIPPVASLTDAKLLTQNPDKHIAINFKHLNTVEFRIFDAPKTVGHIYKYLEFCHALCMFFTDPITGGGGAEYTATWADFMKFATNNGYNCKEW